MCLGRDVFYGRDAIGDEDEERGEGRGESEGN